jgi:hypothetical protein
MNAQSMVGCVNSNFTNNASEAVVFRCGSAPHFDLLTHL